jgi:hypothetical protein
MVPAAAGDDWRGGFGRRGSGRADLKNFVVLLASAGLTNEFVSQDVSLLATRADNAN